MTDHIILTVPATIRWSVVEREFKACEDWGECKLFKVRTLPRSGNVVGGRCYVVHGGLLRGWMSITALVPHRRFKCTTTGDIYEGRFIECSGPFFYQTKPVIHMRGFQGWHYYNPKAVATAA